MEKGNLRVRRIRIRSSSTPQLTIKIRFLRITEPHPILDTGCLSFHHPASTSFKHKKRCKLNELNKLFNPASGTTATSSDSELFALRGRHCWR